MFRGWFHAPDQPRGQKRLGLDLTKDTGRASTPPLLDLIHPNERLEEPEVSQSKRFKTNNYPQDNRSGAGANATTNQVCFMENLQLHIRNVQGKNNRLQCTIEKLNEKIARSQTDKDSLIDQNGKNKEQIQDIQKELTNTQNELQRVQECANKQTEKIGEFKKLREDYYSLEQYVVGVEKLHKVALNDLEAFREQLRIFQAKNDIFQSESSVQKKQIQSLRSEISDAKVIKKQLEESQQELQCCKDDLFRLQPEVQIPDSVVLQDFETVCRRIVNWIDGEIDTWESTHPETEPTYVFSRSTKESTISFMTRNPNAGEYLARYLIHRHLMENLWDRKRPLLGLSEELQVFVQQAGKAMRTSQPPKDDGTIRSWRSETLKAASRYANFKAFKDQQLQSFTRDMFQELAYRFPLLFQRESRTRFYKQVMGPAGSLTMKIQSSTMCYVFSTVLKKEDMAHLVAVDVATGKTLKPDASLRADRTSISRDIVVAIEPGMYRSNDSSKEIVLRRPIYLVDLHRPLSGSERT